MAGRKTNKVIISIGFLLVLIGGLLVIVPLVDGGECSVTSFPTLVLGSIKEEGTPISGANVILYMDEEYMGNTTTNSNGSYDMAPMNYSSNTYLIIIKDGKINSCGPFNIPCGETTPKDITFNSSVPTPDLYIYNLSDPESLKQFHAVTINASIYNNHTYPVGGVDVSFYKDNIIDKNLIGKLYNIFIPPHSTRYVSLSWSVPPETFGNHTIIAVVDPDNKINESNENNNQANISFLLLCDLNNDGIAVKDYNELMQAYKCLLGMGANCYDLNGNGITFQEWNEMKHEYECFNGIFN